MKIQFRDIRLSADNKKKLQVINDIIDEYQEQGYVLTLRQLYYQLVSRDIIPNALPEYAKVSKLLKEGRMAGIVDWDAIEDRLRKPHTPASWSSPRDILEACIQSFQLPRMKGQENYLEVWVEKDALSGVLKRVTEKYHVPILVNRGYSSASAMFDSYERFLKAIENEQKVTILYLGDYDPSGIDMIRDINDRIVEFMKGSDDMKDIFKEHSEYNQYYDEYFHECVNNQGLDEDDETIFELAYEEWLKPQFNIQPIALTIEQIRKYNPPPNPAKITDPRAGKFIAELGKTSWEVDALKPEVLHQLLEDEITERINEDIYDDILNEEKGHIKTLKEFKNSL